MVERSILDKSVDMKDHTAGKNCINKKILIPPGSKTVTLQLLKKIIRPAPETVTA